MAQPHILSQVCRLYVAHECEAGLKSVQTSDKRAFSGPASHSKPSLSSVVPFKCEAGPESVHTSDKKPLVVQLHILSQVCPLYIAHKCEAGLESVRTSDKKAFSGPASHSFQCGAGLESGYTSENKPSVAQPHIPSQVCCLYIAHKYGADLE